MFQVLRRGFPLGRERRYAPFCRSSAILKGSSHLAANFPWGSILRACPIFLHTRSPSWKFRGCTFVLYFLYTIRLQAFAWRMARSLRSSNVSSSILNSPSLTYKSSIYRLKEGSPHSTGNMASMSYVKLNGDFVVTLCGEHR